MCTALNVDFKKLLSVSVDIVHGNRWLSGNLRRWTKIWPIPRKKSQPDVRSPAITVRKSPANALCEKSSVKRGQGSLLPTFSQACPPYRCHCPPQYICQRKPSTCISSPRGNQQTVAIPSDSLGGGPVRFFGPFSRLRGFPSANLALRT